ncbi:VOC family protein [Herbiconiux ginsengi]|uniref:VOC family protein n=1 Tax=Herbiconiux ginsengi TaxID=381665 RepID=UPI000B819E12|nr:VOC family protein [Herbiconiux ginsengi]
MLGSLDEVVFDCAEPTALVRFWHQVLGGSAPTDRSPDWSFFDAPSGLRIAFQRVPEGKSAKNRVHLDVAVDDVPDATDAAERLGAVRQGPLHSDAVGTFQVLLDPEGNEWCVVRAN